MKSPESNPDLKKTFCFKHFELTLRHFFFTGSKTSALLSEKSLGKTSASIPIFDNSNHDGEEFRARRDFLKSGLPESFRKQLAKTAASKEAYSLSCSSFQPVVHVQQRPNGEIFLFDECF